MSIELRKRDRIYLTGFMGSGKSTIGPILANTIGFDFVDVDLAIEQELGRTINEIFREEGEGRFRSVERTVLLGCMQAPRTVIALGGGTIADPETFDAIRESGVLVYLRVSPDQLFPRLRPKEHRPLLLDSSGDRISDEILLRRMDTLFRQREPFYAMADIIVNTGNQTVGRAVDEIVRKLSPLLR